MYVYMYIYTYTYIYIYIHIYINMYLHTYQQYYTRVRYIIRYAQTMMISNRQEFQGEPGLLGPSFLSLGLDPIRTSMCLGLQYRP